MSIDLTQFATTASVTSSLAGKTDTSHLCNSLGDADVNYGAHDFRAETVTLQHASSGLTLGSDPKGNL